MPNLQVIKLMQSFVSRELVTERFAWRHFYWCVPPATLNLVPVSHAALDIRCNWRDIIQK